MRKATLVLILFVQTVVLPQSAKPTVESAAWLAGCWEINTGGRLVNEHWMKPAGGAMIGMSRTVSKNKMSAYEFLQIRTQDDGEVYYVARPSGQAEASFKLIKSGPQELIFENPEHDFPQRIIYRQQSDGKLNARVEGKNNGKEMGFDFPYKRAQCF
jgi:hypothetical protein